MHKAARGATLREMAWAARLAIVFGALLSTAACSRSSDTASATAGATRLTGDGTMKKLWDWNGIIGTGQSLSVGVGGTPLRATQPSHQNLKLDLGNRFFPALDDTSSRLSLVPLCEPIRPFGSGFPTPFPSNIQGETPHTCMASQITELTLAETAGKGDYVTVHSVVGESGQGMKALSKGAVFQDDVGYAYAASLFEARAIARLAKQAQRSFGVAAIVLTHGETDAQNPGYQAALYRLLQDYNTDLPVITGQSFQAPLLVTQQSSSPPEAAALADSALAVWKACREHPGRILCVGPRYQYGYVDHVHLDALGYDRLGEKYGQVYFERVVKERDFQPLAPLSVERSGNLLSVAFHVPVPPLVWDETLPLPHAGPRLHAWAKGRGFELTAGGAPVAIDSVEIVGSKVNIVASSAPAGALTIRYAATASDKPRPGGSWRWGQLRDSDPFVGAVTRTPQPNHAVAFELSSP